MNEQTGPTAAYQSRLSRFGAARDAEANRSRFVAYARLATSLAGAACLVAGLTRDGEMAAPLLWAGGALILLFAALAVWHARIEARQAEYHALCEINGEGLKRLARDWRGLPQWAVPGSLAQHPYAADLDLFGRASLFQLLWPGGTETGKRILSGWLLSPGPAEQALERQEAVGEMAPLLDLRQSLAASARAGQVAEHDVDRFLEWTEGMTWFVRRAWAVWAARGLTAATIALIVLRVAGVLERPYWLLAALVNLVFTAPFARRANQTFDKAFSQHAVFLRYADLALKVGATRFESTLLVELQAELNSPETGAPQAFRRLHRLMSLADLRHSALLHLPVNALTLWDLHVLAALERWQEQAGGHARRWVNAIGNIEAMGALAGLLHDNPRWTLPRIDEGRCEVVRATALGHPLIRPDRRVDNDVEVGPPGTFLLVTGSNMSGKSTLLRAIGLNAVLAGAGGPVCASSMEMPPVRLATSMRIGDSLEDGLSYFMAALKRLKEIVDAARVTPDGQPTILLYLLDEVLGGTNTAERQVAVRRIIRHLVGCRAIGAVTTHDLDLAAHPDLRSSAHAVHFSETLDAAGSAGNLSFDYKLQEGIATSRNALKLMELVGLGDV